jgi:cytochrome c
MRTLLLSTLLLSSAVWAVEPGQVAFGRACARCHPAEAKPRGKLKAKVDRAKGDAPEIGALVRARSYAGLRKWIEAPHRQKPDTGCDTRMLRPGELDALMSYLQSAARPPLPPPEVRLTKGLERSIAQRKAALKKKPQQGSNRDSRRDKSGGGN